ncbi:GNAT family N-acetyltransferase [Kineococcus sp. SYSU DK001]|uniref:GNAT family N-acetyltransferase n=1 Tax=Kineococcus sp. SYSU DK001 TaxID=3383122 RepID=UPI003D7D83CD
MAWNYPSELAVAPGVRLRLSRPADAGTITGWLGDERVHRGWGGAPVPLAEVQAKYTGARLPDVVVHLVETAAGPVGLVQAWRDGDRCGLDMFLAAHAQGRGLGPVVARALAAELTRRGWRGLTVDPAADDVRAVRAWRRAGFVPTGDRTADGRGLLMVFAGDVTTDPGRRPGTPAPGPPSR